MSTLDILKFLITGKSITDEELKKYAIEKKFENCGIIHEMDKTFPNVNSAFGDAEKQLTIYRKLLDEYHKYDNDRSFFSKIIDDSCGKKIEERIKALTPRNLDEGLGRKKRKSYRKSTSKHRRNKRTSSNRY
jgi:hypothetical protein